MDAQASPCALAGTGSSGLSDQPDSVGAGDAARLAPLVATMRDRLRSIELSRFWWLRNRFFDLKRRLGFSIDGAWPTFEVPAEYRSLLEISAIDPYLSWISSNEPRPPDLARMRAASTALRNAPDFAIVLTSGADSKAEALTKRSLAEQAYSRWRIVPDFEAAADEEFVAWATAGDTLAPHALFTIAVAIANDGDVDIAYTDEDTIDDAGTRSMPFFKPDYGVETLLSRPYFGNLCAYRARVLRKAAAPGGPTPADAYDRALRAVETAKRVVHVPEVVYHRAAAYPRIGAEGSVAIEQAMARRGERGTATLTPSGTHVVRYEPSSDPELVSIIMPTRDHGEDLDRALRSIFERTTYPRFEVIIVDNGSREPAALAVLQAWRERESRIRVLPMDIPFNYSRLNNVAARTASGSILLLLNNDVEVITPDWIEAMAEQARRPAIGAVGATLRFPDGSVQHAGVVMGLGGLAGHGHRGTPKDGHGYFGALRALNNVSAVTGACLMVRKSLYDRVGGLDEELTVAFNDVDFCLRLQAAGYRNVVLPHVELVHFESLSRGHDIGLAKVKRSVRESELMLQRWGPIIENDPHYSPHLTRRDESYTIRSEVDL